MFDAIMAAAIRPVDMADPMPAERHNRSFGFEERPGGWARLRELRDRYRTVISVSIVILLALLGFAALDHLLHEVSVHDIRHAWHAMPAGQLLLAAGLTGASYVMLTFYDVMALRAIHRPLPYRTAALASFTSYTLSHNLGLSLLTGGSARYRIYSAAGLDLADIARVIALAGATFWGGVIVLSGAMLAWRPEVLAVEGVDLPPDLVRGFGIVLLLGIVALLAWTGQRGRSLHVGRWLAPVPPAASIGGQLAVGVLDLAAASAALFVMVPGVGIDAWPVFFMGYTLAIIAVLITHVPGGIGVFEAVMLVALPGVGRPDLIAALLVYRFVYYVAPLLIAVILVVGLEGFKWRRSIARTARGVQVVATSLAPMMIAALVFLGGTVLLVSGSLPTVPWRGMLLYAVLPMPFVEASHLAGSLVGAALLVLSAGLYRRLDAAFWLTRILLLAGAVFSLLKGLDYEEATVMLIIAATLQWARPAFYRRTHFLAEAFTPGWLLTVTVVLGLTIWIGFFAYRHVDYQNDLWWHFSEKGNASRFLRASFVVAVLMSVVGMLRLFRPAAPRADIGVVDRVPQPAMDFAERADANLAYTGDKRFLVSETGQAFVMFQVRGSSWIVMGDPVGPRAEWTDLLWRLRELADASQGVLLLYQISAAALPVAIELGLQITKYGEEAHVDLTSFTLEGPAAKGLRHAERRAERDGAQFRIAPAAEVPFIIDELRAISSYWLGAKGHREKGFSVGRFETAYLSHFDCALVSCRGRIVAFANIWETPDHSELSIDLMRHGKDMPYGTMDYLFSQLMLWGQAHGYRQFNLGMAPLSGIEARRLSPIWSKLGALLYQHGNALYGFEGLRSYKAKFNPDWQPRFVAGPQGLPFARALIDLQALIGSAVPAKRLR